MNIKAASGATTSQWPNSPWSLGQDAFNYAVDAWQRTILYADVERQVGDQYQSQLHKEAPNVLNFPGELLMSGLDLARPVNYGLVRIKPAEGQITDEAKRPFIVVDPRAGHGPGIGGFKSDSEIGAALQAGHPCYFIGFLPNPVPGQTVEDVMRAEAEFVREVAKRHPQSHGKPAVIGNCQAGWQILMTAAVWPELFGPIIVAGAPVSYWAGDNPMRYTGGMLGGSWLTALTGDLGAGHFDGAWLVQNFENLNPANTLWSKQYNLYANIDTEAPRYLGFEKYWGGHVLLNDIEMQYIADNLFIGNKLSTAQLVTSDGIRVDLRNIRSPILVFCSYGDNITPPAQALGWITDLYRDDREIVGHDQTIVYATHESIGHLGIFVSASVGRKEHRKFAAAIDQIDLLPSGVYHATIDDTRDQAEKSDDPYLLSIHRSSVEEVRAIVKPDPEADRRFSAAAKISEINLALYRSFAQPWVRAFSSPYSAHLLQKAHPLRMAFERWSSDKPGAAALAQLAEQTRQQRKPVAADNAFLQLQGKISTVIEQVLDEYRDRRDGWCADLFAAVYGSPWLQALAGQVYGDAAPVRAHPGESPEQRRFLRAAEEKLQSLLYQGGVREAALRALFYVLQQREEVDERHYHYASQLPYIGLEDGQDFASFRDLVRTQAVLLAYHVDQAIQAIPYFLVGVEPAVIDEIADAISHCARIGDAAPNAATEQALKRVLDILSEASRREIFARKSARENSVVSAEKQKKNSAASAGKITSTAARTRVAKVEPAATTSKAVAAKTAGRANARGAAK
jgi:pimeloyl-ACP methyl ester carboxylesterase